MMFKKLLLGAIPTLVAGIAVLTMSAPQQTGVSLDRVATLVKHSSPTSHASSHAHGHAPNKAAHNTHRLEKSTVNSGDQAELTIRQHPDWGRGYHGYRGYRGYRGYGHYYGYRPYYSYGGFGELDDE
jgi:hypothetical protein